MIWKLRNRVLCLWSRRRWTGVEWCLLLWKSLCFHFAGSDSQVLGRSTCASLITAQADSRKPGHCMLPVRRLPMYTPVPVLALLALLAGAFGLVPSPQAQAVVHILLVATLGGSVMHLQVLAGMRLAMLMIPALLLACATLVSFAPRLSHITPVLFLVFILTTLPMTVYLFLRRRRRALPLALVPVPPSPASSHTSFACTPIEKPPPAFLRSSSKLTLLGPLRRTSLSQPTCPPTAPHTTTLLLLLAAQLTYTLATAFCIPPALRTPGRASSLVVSLVSLSSTHTHLSSTYIFRILDTAFTVLTLLFVFLAYYNHSRSLALHVQAHTETSTTPMRTPTIPRRPNIHILSPPASRSKLQHSRSPTPEPPSPTTSSITCVPTPPTTPPRPRPRPSDPSPPIPIPLRLPPGTRMSPGPSARSPVLITPPPARIICKRAWSWHTHSPAPTPTPAPAPLPTQDVVLHMSEEGDFMDLRDPFASAGPSAYSRWVAGVGVGAEDRAPHGLSSSSARSPLSGRPRSSSYDACMHPKTRARTQMSTWGRLALPSQSWGVVPSSDATQRVRFGVDGTTTTASPSCPSASSASPTRPCTPPPPRAESRRTGVGVDRARDADTDTDTDAIRGVDEDTDVDVDVVIAQKLLAQLGTGTGTGTG
ncbi:hypothetical protein H2248_005358 [Termitomyces sp. 'cryptogamus']|nr:hypothetical protein H2248_005358 [Termitomyces sp. 'cryptogamus']